MELRLNNVTVTELVGQVGHLVERIPQSEWDQDIITALEKEFPLAPVVWVQRYIADATHPLGIRRFVKGLEGTEKLKTIFSYIESDTFHAQDGECKKQVWAYRLLIQELNELPDEEEQAFIQRVAKK